ncbi:MAG: carbohydrate-binding family 6 protein [Armatimonadetes bacterium]|nr:carbohydrate-binding family 6 protein [Armatimonadota bacterium]
MSSTPVVTRRSEAAPVAFAAAEIAAALQAREAAGLKEILLEEDGRGPAQSYRFSRPTPDTLVVTGGDAVGAMYGGLDVAEAIRFGTLARLPLVERRPHIAARGIKFNVPLDLRTPSYSCSGDSFQANIPEVWDLDFWRAYLDEMARNRLNVLSLWSLHPFPSLVKVPEFPDVALDDVLRATKKFDMTFRATGINMFREEYLEGAEVIRRMTIEEKIAHWRAVLACARDRGIEVYLFTWNIYLYGTMGKYGLTLEENNPETIRYFRASVRETVLTYPLLAGIGLAAGEQMPRKSETFNPERWLRDTYGAGIRDALAQQPGRRFRLIHRYHGSSQEEIVGEFADYPGDFDFSFKYSTAHLLSIPNPIFINRTLETMPPGMKTWLTLRNDSNYLFRWADPDFVRDYINNMPGADRLAGFYMGADGYCWGRVADSTEPETPPRLYLQKQWFTFMLFGRLGFDPTLPNSHFERAVADRFPEMPAGKLLDAWTAASRTLPLITRFYWGGLDLHWYPEGCFRNKGFHSVRHFAESFWEPIRGSGIIGITEWRDPALRGEPIPAITPLDIASDLEANAARALRLVGELKPFQGDRKELRLTLGDIEALAHLGRHYAEKIRGAAEIALFDADPKPERRAAAIAHLEIALEHWRRYAAIAKRQYKPQLLNRVGYLDFDALTEKVAADITMAREWEPGSLGTGEKRP